MFKESKIVLKDKPTEPVINFLSVESIIEDLANEKNVKTKVVFDIVISNKLHMVDTALKSLYVEELLEFIKNHIAEFKEPSNQIVLKPWIITEASQKGEALKEHMSKLRSFTDLKELDWWKVNIHRINDFWNEVTTLSNVENFRETARIFKQANDTITQGLLKQAYKAIANTEGINRNPDLLLERKHPSSNPGLIKMILQRIFNNLAKQGGISPDVLCQNTSVVNITQLDLSKIIPSRILLIGDDAFIEGFRIRRIYKSKKMRNTQSKQVHNLMV